MSTLATDTPIFVELRGEGIPADLANLVTPGECPACLVGTCVCFPAYLRISDDKIDADVDTSAALTTDRGVVRQAGKILELAHGHGGTHVIFHVDNDLSASKERKTKALWWDVLRYVEANRPTWLYALKADRLGRRLSDLETLDDLRVTTGTRVWTLAEGDLFANAAWPFLAAMAKVEAQQISWRQRQSQQSRMAKGLDPGGGNRPFGFAADRITVIPAEAELIREVARQFIAAPNASEICRVLAKLDVPRPNGAKLWTPVVLRAILSRPRYGDWGNGRGMRVRNTAGRENRNKRQSFEIVGPGAWPAILDRASWELVQDRLKATSQTHGPHPVSLLGGIARCAYCETPLHAGKGGAGQPMYRCSKSPAVGGCGKVNRVSTALDAYVTDWALSQLDADVTTGEADTVRAEADRLAEESTATELRIAALRERYAAGTVADEDYYATLDALRKAVRGLDREHTAAIVKLDGLISESSIRERWETMTTEQRRRFIARKAVAIRIFKATKRGVLGEGEIEIR